MNVLIGQAMSEDGRRRVQPLGLRRSKFKHQLMTVSCIFSTLPQRLKLAGRWLRFKAYKGRYTLRVDKFFVWVKDLSCRSKCSDRYNTLPVVLVCGLDAFPSSTYLYATVPSPLPPSSRDKSVYYYYYSIKFIVHIEP